MNDQENSTNQESQRNVYPVQAAPSDLESGGGDDRAREDDGFRRKKPQPIGNGTNHDGESIGNQTGGDPVPDQARKSRVGVNDPFSGRARKS